MFVIALLLVVAGGGFGYWLLTRSDELLRQAVAKRVAEILPGWDVEIGRARFDWERQVYIWNTNLKAGSQGATLVHVPEIALTVDGEALSQNQQVVVQRVRISGAQIEIVQDEKGNWNWQDLPKLPKSNLALPEFEIVRANVRVRLEHGSGPPTVLHVSDADFRLVPSGKRRFIVQGLTQVDRAGRLHIQEGRWNVDDGTWSIQGEMRDVQAGADLLELIATTSPELGQKLANLDKKLQSLGPQLPTGGSAPVIRTAQNESTGTGFWARPAAHDAAHSGNLQGLGVQAALDVEFRATRWQPKAEPEFATTVTVRQGTIANPSLPFPLRDVEGVIRWDNHQVLLTGVSANHGATRLRLEGKVEREGAATPASFDIQVSQLSLDDRLRSRLPPNVQKLYDTIRPSGQVDGSVQLVHDVNGRWTYQNLKLFTKGGRCTPTKFPYPVHSVQGSITQQPGNVLEIDMQAMAGRTPVRALGFAKNPGPEAEVTLTVTTDTRLPIDDSLRAAFEPFPGIRRTADLLGLEGYVQEGAQVTLRRNPGIGQKFQPHIVARVSDCSLNYKHFPYRLTELSGDFLYQPDSKKCTFSNLKARHHAATLKGHGYFVKQTEPGFLSLVIEGTDAQLDHSLARALPEPLQAVWDEFSPSGRIDEIAAIVNWSPGDPRPHVVVHHADVSDSEFRLRSFPYPINGIAASFRYNFDRNYPDRIDIDLRKGSHEGTEVSARGFVDCPPNGTWRLRLNEFTADDLMPNSSFRSALPLALRSVCNELNPRDPMSLSGWLELQGAGLEDSRLRAAWNVTTAFSEARFTAGLEFEGASGRVSSEGTWDGGRVQTQGLVELDSVYVWGYQFTEVKGPYRLNDTQLTVGTDNVAAGPRTQRISATRSGGNQMEAKFVGGKVYLDAVATLDESPSYTVKAEIKDGYLEEYARLYMPGTSNLQGKLNGWVVVNQPRAQPKMSGRGELLISPAALYELPVMAQIFKSLNSVLNSVRPDNTAFNYAYLDYRLDDEKFMFDRIDLVGDALSLRGHGVARYDHQLGLTFYSRPPRSRLLPQVVSNFLGDATQGWMAVEVTGRTEAPQARYIAAPVLEDSWKRLLKAFDPAQPVPGLRVPQFFPTPGQWGIRPTPTKARQ